MRNFLRKLHITPNQSEIAESSSSKGTRLGDGGKSPPSRSLLEQKPLSRIAGWWSSVTARHGSSPPSSSNVSGGDSNSRRDVQESLNVVAAESEKRDSGSSNSRDPELEEEYQIQLALELSAREDPEAVQIEAAKQISLGSCPLHNTPAEFVAYRYWNYNALSYDDKILDGFYDLYGILAESAADKMPSLVDLQRTPVSDSVSWEAILVNRASDSELLRLEQNALEIAVSSRLESFGFVDHNLVQKLAILVADNMGKHVENPEKMLKAWRIHSNHLRELAGNVVLPLGQLKIGLARHRALLFKVLADNVGVPCRLLKGQQFTGSDDVAMNIVKLDDGREYIVDLMADPGTLIPSDTTGSQIELEEPFSGVGSIREVDHVGACSSSASGSMGSQWDYVQAKKKVNLSDFSVDENSRHRTPHKEVSPELKARLTDELLDHRKGSKGPVYEVSGQPNHPFTHARSPSWTEGVSSPAVRKMKMKDASQYMINAAKENPQLAQKLHNVLLESGVIAPANLFTEIYTDPVEDGPSRTREIQRPKSRKDGNLTKSQVEGLPGPVLPPLPNQTKSNSLKPLQQIQKEVDGLGVYHLFDSSVSHEVPLAVKFVKNVPVAAAAAATAAVVASSMVVAASKSSADSNIEVPVAAAAAVVATAAAVTKRYEQLESSCLNQADRDKKIGGGGSGSGNDTHGTCNAQDGRIERDSHGTAGYPDGDRNSDKSTGNESVKLDIALDDVAEWEIQWEEITLGERIGLGSYGEVYRGEWYGTEVAVKRFLDQDISGDALEEFRSEVRIMKRLRHPNVVLFMGAVTQPPNLSIVTEFLPRGSLYRLLHRPNNQLDERRRLRMALDIARGMNYLHNCTPVIVHRDLKSPNLLVDKNWVVKVCDFGLSRMKHNTFLSSRSTAGTAEWMAPEVLRNELSDEKCDVFSFGIILWELTTLQQPWGGMNSMQVVGAVGFQHRRLDIPGDMDPVIADIIQNCWQTDPKLRPSFSEIMAALRPLQRPITNTQAQAPRPRIPSGSVSGQDKGRLPGDGDPRSQGSGANCGAAGGG